ncbi:MAG TPA: hypothetical protein VIL94_05925, partial [Acidothermaceae bacterium]
MPSRAVPDGVVDAEVAAVLAGDSTVLAVPVEPAPPEIAEADIAGSAALVVDSDPAETSAVDSDPAEADASEADTTEADGDALPSSSRRVRNRLVRLATPRTSTAGSPVLEPLIRAIRVTHPKADVRAIQRAYEVAEHHHRLQSV